MRSPCSTTCSAAVVAPRLLLAGVNGHDRLLEGLVRVLLAPLLDLLEPSFDAALGGGIRLRPHVEAGGVTRHPLTEQPGLVLLLGLEEQPAGGSANAVDAGLGRSRRLLRLLLRLLLLRSLLLRLLLSLDRME